MSFRKFLSDSPTDLGGVRIYFRTGPAVGRAARHASHSLRSGCCAPSAATTLVGSFMPARVFPGPSPRRAIAQLRGSVAAAAGHGAAASPTTPATNARTAAPATSPKHCNLGRGRRGLHGKQAGVQNTSACAIGT